MNENKIVLITYFKIYDGFEKTIYSFFFSITRLVGSEMFINFSI